jgi:hypothetical protein
MLKVEPSTFDVEADWHVGYVSNKTDGMVIDRTLRRCLPWRSTIA